MGIEAQFTWRLLTKSLLIFEEMDADHSGKLEYAEFARFGELIGLDAEETELLFHSLDANQTGSIDIVEMFQWFKKRLRAQHKRIEMHKQTSIVFGDEEREECEQIRKQRTESLVTSDRNSNSP